MRFDVDFSLLECDIEFGPGFGSTVWFQYPACPPFHEYFGSGSCLRSPISDGYQFEGILVLIAIDRLDRFYNSMSNHEKMELHAAEEEARSRRRRAQVESRDFRIRHLYCDECDCWEW